MKSLIRWHQVRAQQTFRRDLPRAHVLDRSAKTWGTKAPEPTRGGNKKFVVGETLVGGEEVVG